MPSAGPNAAGTGTGTGWANPSDITATGGAYATLNLGHGATSNPLIGTNFGFSIPGTATVTGVVTSLIAFANNSAIDLVVSSEQLVNGGVPIGTAITPFDNLNLSPGPIAHGNPSFLWGAALTPAIINSATFGFQAQINNDGVSGGDTANINGYAITVYYAGGGSGGGGTPSVGGVASLLNLAIFPLTQGTTGFMYQLDPTNFNDANSGSFYNYKVEDVIAGRVATVSRVILSYRDLGIANITINLFGIDDQTQKPIGASIGLQIGTAQASQKICTKVIGLALTGLNLQANVTRAANAGPVSITKLRLEGRVEKTSYA